MLITDTFIYFQLQKTGCSHTQKILTEIFKEKSTSFGKHYTYDKVPSELLGDFRTKLKVGNVRNPWDWYVSLWAFGCEQKGGVYTRLTQPKENESPKTKKSGINPFKKNVNPKYSKIDHEVWKRLYSDVNKHENFHEWLSLILLQNKHDIGEGYKTKSLSRFAGFFTYRYFKLYTYRKALNSIKTWEDVKRYDRNENFMDIVLKNESLHEDLLNNAQALDFKESQLQKALENNTERTNKSLRNRDYRNYYNDSSKTLVEEYEQFIIEKYNYQF